MTTPTGLAQDSASAAGAGQTHYRTCHLCEAMCGVALQVHGGRVVSVRGDKDDPLSRGYICPKAAALGDLQDDPDRLRHPLRRTAAGKGLAGYTRISWDEALAEVAERLPAIQAAHGNNAVAVYAGNPTVHNYSALLSWLFFVKSLRTRSRFSATSVDQLPHHLTSLLMFGHQLLLPIPDVDRTDFMLILGANPAVSNGSLMTAPGIAKRLTAIRERGGQVVLRIAHGEDHRRRVHALGADVAQEAQAVGGGHAQVEHHQVGLVLAQQADHRARVAGGGGHGHLAAMLQQVGQAVAAQRVVVDQHDLQARLSHGRLPRRRAWRCSRPAAPACRRPAALPRSTRRPCERPARP